MIDEYLEKISELLERIIYNNNYLKQMNNELLKLEDRESKLIELIDQCKEELAVIKASNLNISLDLLEKHLNDLQRKKEENSILIDDLADEIEMLKNQIDEDQELYQRLTNNKNGKKRVKRKDK